MFLFDFFQKYISSLRRRVSSAAPQRDLNLIRRETLWSRSLVSFLSLGLLQWNAFTNGTSSQSSNGMKPYKIVQRNFSKKNCDIPWESENNRQKHLFDYNTKTVGKWHWIGCVIAIKFLYVYKVGIDGCTNWVVSQVWEEFLFFFPIISKFSY